MSELLVASVIAVVVGVLAWFSNLRGIMMGLAFVITLGGVATACIGLCLSGYPLALTAFPLWLGIFSVTFAWVGFCLHVTVDWFTKKAEDAETAASRAYDLGKAEITEQSVYDRRGYAILASKKEVYLKVIAKLKDAVADPQKTAVIDSEFNRWLQESDAAFEARHKDAILAAEKAGTFYAYQPTPRPKNP